MKKLQPKKRSTPVQLIEGVHFYVENGRYVFTETYLKERGFCCQNGCRHCPYGFSKKK